MNQVQLQQELNEIKRQLKKNFINEKEVLNSKEFLSYLNISYSMLTKLTSNSLIPFYKPTNGLLFFFKDDIDEWIRKNKIYTDQDVEDLLKKSLIFSQMSLQWFKNLSAISDLDIENFRKFSQMKDWKLKSLLKIYLNYSK